MSEGDSETHFLFWINRGGQIGSNIVPDGALMNSIYFSRLSLDLARESFAGGAFPAGAVLVCKGEIVAKNTSAKFPKIIFHAESKTIDEAMEKLNRQLDDCTLYTSMEPCLMCLSRAYWAGIRKICYVVRKEKVDPSLCYEMKSDHKEIVKELNQKIEMIWISELEDEALVAYKSWVETVK